MNDDKEKCKTCHGHGIVNTPWPSGYPHGVPCPECRPNVPCHSCIANDIALACPGIEAIVKWKIARVLGE